MPPYYTMNTLDSPWNRGKGEQVHTNCSMQWVDGAIIVGAGPSGMATAACLKELGLSTSLLLEKSTCIASLWQERTYDRLCLHLPKQFCQLPMSPFPSHFPTYPSKQQFVDYLREYADKFGIRPRFGEMVESACFDPRFKLWRVQTRAVVPPAAGGAKVVSMRQYIGRWLVVATGENAEARLPLDLPGSNHLLSESSPIHKVYHSSEYTNGSKFRGERVLVVGAGNSGMEIALDLLQFGANPTLVVRSPIHVLPREMLGNSTFGVIRMMMKLLPLWLTDRLLVLYALIALGDTSRHGIKRPKAGPLELKEKLGRTPVLDIGTLAHIRKGDIKVVPGIESFTRDGAKFVNGEQHSYDSIIFATGYKCNVPKWLKDTELSFSSDGFPNCGWNSGRGLYMAGLTRQGILGVSRDAKLIAENIHKSYTSQQQKKHKLTHRSSS